MSVTVHVSRIVQMSQMSKNVNMSAPIITNSYSKEKIAMAHILQATVPVMTFTSSEALVLVDAFHGRECVTAHSSARE